MLVTQVDKSQHDMLSAMKEVLGETEQAQSGQWGQHGEGCAVLPVVMPLKLQFHHATKAEQYNTQAGALNRVPLPGSLDLKQLGGQFSICSFSRELLHCYKC